MGHRRKTIRLRKSHKHKRKSKHTLKHKKKLRGGVKTYKHNSRTNTRIPMPYSRTSPNPQFTSNLPTGNELRRELVKLHEEGDLDEYEDLVQKIIMDYHRNNNKGFFIHLDRNITSFKPTTLQALERALTRMQEEAIPESMIHLSYILEHKSK